MHWCSKVYLGLGAAEKLAHRAEVGVAWVDAPTSTYANSEYINTRGKYINTPCSAPPPSPPSAFKSPGFLAGARVQDPHWGYRPLNQAAGHERVAYGRRGGGGIWGEHPVCGGSEANAPRPPPPAEASTGVDGLPGVDRQRDGLVGSSAAAVRTLGWRRPDKGEPTGKCNAADASQPGRRLSSHNATWSHDATPRSSKYTTNAMLSGIDDVTVRRPTSPHHFARLMEDPR